MPLVNFSDLDFNQVKITLKDYLKKDTVVSALKGHIGHAMGACSLAELTYTIMMMNKGIALHTAHLKDPCDDYFNLITEPKEMQINYIFEMYQGIQYCHS